MIVWVEIAGGTFPPVTLYVTREGQIICVTIVAIFKQDKLC